LGERQYPVYYVTPDHERRTAILDSVDRVLSERLNSEQNVPGAQFDFNQHTLTPWAREKLAKVEGICWRTADCVPSLKGIPTTSVVTNTTSGFPGCGPMPYGST
jgi:hypothetical protein